MSDINELVRSGQITPAQSARLIELRRQLRQSFWRGFFEGMAIWPLLARAWRRWINRRTKEPTR